MMDTGKIASIQGKITDVNSTVEATERASKTDEPADFNPADVIFLGVSKDEQTTA